VRSAKKTLMRKAANPRNTVQKKRAGLDSMTKVRGLKDVRLVPGGKKGASKEGLDSNTVGRWVFKKQPGSSSG